MLTLALSDIRRILDKDQRKEAPMREISQRLNTVMTPSEWVQAVRQITAPERSTALIRSLEINGITFDIKGDPITRRTTSEALDRITVRSTREAKEAA